MKTGEKKAAGTVEIEKHSSHKDLLAKSEVSLWIDNYDDVFSDFDPRPFENRALSHDFLDEAKRATLELEQGKLELRLLMPAYEREPNLENVIRHRLHEHFRKHANLLEKEMNRIFVKALLFLLLGFSLMIISVIIHQARSEEFFFSLIKTILEPSGWFMMWYGFDQVFYSSKDLKPDLKFYEMMAKSELIFDSY